ncbi:MAG TPA: lysophospholipid acyltransferase family protein [Acidimicrobiia bacterium]|nr:lysophospholipid acyltransferase family protein [Acidimicrobiia bacterium]
MYTLAAGVLKPLLRRGLDWTVDGDHLVPRHGPAILASNHVSYLDPLVVAYVIDERQRRCRFLAKAELFDKRGLGWALRQIHQIPVLRNTGDAGRSLDAAVEALRKGEIVAIFPEGTISLDLEPMAPKTGTARLAQLSGMPVVPVGLWGAHRVLFKGRKPNWQRGVAQVVCLGAPVKVGPDDDVREASDRIMTAVVEQVRRARAMYPQVPEPGEDDWWVRSPETAVLRSCREEAAS